ncbi:MFS transporter [Solicola sp. PLA-1-18]|uniref:MFS transporter n=1 Tax=Solicola sp. PLA-1-18 TaxID=3380532 RepID=UPI003B81F67B
MDEQPPPPRSDGPSDPPGRASRAVRAGGRAARSVGRASTGTVRQARRFTQAKGAGESGLSRLLEMHAFNTAGDAAVAVSLAGTLFFTVPTGEARGQVAQFLLLTMLPFAIVAPVIGPFLDRFRRGRRWSIGTTMAVRAFCCWVMSTAVQDGSYALFPAALGCLVASKAYGVTRAAAVPRVLPRSFTLVKANSRISLTGTIGAAVSAPLAVGAAAIGAEWALRYAFVLFVVATVLAVLLPSRVDSSAGEEPVAMSSLRGDSDTRRRLGITFAVVHGLRCNTGLRFLSGFLTMFMAFVLRESPFPGWQPTVLMGLVIGAAGVGNTAGVLLGSVMKSRRPETTVLVVLAVDAALVTLAAVVWALPTAVLLGLTVGVCQSLGKLSLDALIQRDVPEAVRTSVFARSETLLQLAWVVGGFLGLGIGLQTPQLGLGVTAVILVVWFGLVAKGSLGRIDADAPRRVS